ncbi:MAG: glycosyltransferase family 2 protein [Bacteroidota bacterium]
MKPPLVSIVTINYNQTKVTEECINSLHKITYPNFEIIVVDNASSEDASILKKLYPNVTLILSKENLGFSGGNNLGINKSNGDFILFLNNDTEVDRSFLEPLVNIFQEKKDVGLACSKLVYYGTEIIQYAGSTNINPFTGRSKRIGFKQNNSELFSKSYLTDLPHGAAMMISRKVLNKVGLMPEVFFLYYEEVDWAESIKKHGYNIWFVGHSTVFHKESMSTGKNSTLKTYFLNRNRILYLRRNTSGLVKLFWIIFYILVSIPKNILIMMMKNEFNHLRVYLKAIAWNLSNKPKEHISKPAYLIK